MSLVNHNSLCILVLEWIKRQVTEESQRVESLSEKTFMLYLAIDNSLQDCSGLPSGDISDTEIVQDYKKMSSKTLQPNSKNKRKCLSQPVKPRVLIYSREIGEDIEMECEPDWNLIATWQVAEHCTLALVTLGGKLATLSVQLRLNTPTTPSPVSTPDSSRCGSEEKPDLYCTIKNMTSARCAVGCGNLQNTLLVCGGYDRIECLRSVEQYIPETNTWKLAPSMREARGRFQIAVLGDKVYAVGGSNGTTELDTMEMLDLSVGKSFLNTIEYLDQNSNEWTTFIPKGSIDVSYHRKPRNRRNSARKSISEDTNKTIKPDIINEKQSINNHTPNGTTS
ncbi:hypothetical protein FQA39_LY14162 [Lamprigera yunnana]|nr:hypothetical protein FQA39_LY14162 [Lamprigera yunnana]